MKKTKSIIIIFIATMCLGIGGAAALFHALNYNFNAELSHFFYDSVTAMLSTIALIISFIAAAAAFFISGKDLKMKASRHQSGFFGIFISTLAACICTLSGVVGIMGGIPEDKPAIFILRISFTLLSAIFFFVEALGLINKRPVLGIASLIPAVQLAFTILSTYFDPATSMNSGAKTFQILMLVSFMLYFKDKAGVAISRNGIGRKFIFSGILATGFGATVAIPRFISSFVYGNGLKLSIVETSTAIIFWAYTVVHLAEVLWDLKRVENGEEELEEETEEIKEDANKSNEEGKENTTPVIATARISSLSTKPSKALKEPCAKKEVKESTEDAEAETETEAEVEVEAEAKAEDASKTTAPAEADIDDEDADEFYTTEN